MSALVCEFIDEKSRHGLGKVNDIISAIGSIDDGAGAVRGGTGKLYDATGTLNSKVGQLNSGAGALASGAVDLYSGLSSITAKNGQLTGAAYAAYEGLCTAAAAALNTQLEANDLEPVSFTPSAYIDLICVGECTGSSNFLS